MKKTVLMLCITFLSFIIQAQEKELVLGIKHKLQSNILNKAIEVQIYLPSSYGTKDQSYPVLYILNGDRWFLNGVNLAKTFPTLGLSPEFVVVGVNVNTIENPRERYAFFTQGSQGLADFLEKELLPYIDENYSASEERMLFGWEYAGGFVVENLFKNATLFEAYFAASPFPIAGSRLQLVNQKIEGFSDNKKFLHFAASINEGQVKDQSEQLADLLKQKAPSSLKWNYELIATEESTGIGHLTTPFNTLYQGLRNYYFDYGRLEFPNVKAFQAAGGLEHVKQYYQNRATRYQLEDKIPLEGMFSLVRMATKEDDFQVFDLLMLDFVKNGLIEMLDPRTSVGYAQYYMRNEGYSAAKNIYEMLVKKHPKEPTPANGIGQVYQALGNKKKAVKWYEKAVDLAQQSKHPRLAQFEKDLQEIKQK